MYTNAVFRMVEKLPNCRGIIGPWSHNWPDESTPGPQVCIFLKMFCTEAVTYFSNFFKYCQNIEAVFGTVFQK